MKDMEIMMVLGTSRNLKIRLFWNIGNVALCMP